MTAGVAGNVVKRADQLNVFNFDSEFLFGDPMEDPPRRSKKR